MTRESSRLAIREDAYRLLASCFYLPSQELFEERCLPALADLLEDLAPDAARHAREAAHAGEQASLESLAVEHARLFIGPFHLVAPPYGSFYLDDAKTVMGESTGRVSAFYGSCGLNLADDFHELPDHIAVELEFLSFLVHKERESDVAGDRGEANRFAGLQRFFLDRFLLLWLPPFTRSILEGTESPFYQAIARCAEIYLTSDREFLERLSGATRDTTNPRTS
ncbi:MAG: molecular chaperone TorD family protein [Deltaproteobacteria bacterium]|nr:molecular chaperone TorD family protein [Deltaproteobacteria bacterium]